VLALGISLGDMIGWVRKTKRKITTKVHKASDLRL
jgi:hypothetical protein